MSHASLTNDGLLLGLLAAVLVLVTFIRAVFRAPLQPGQPPAQPVPGDPGPQDARLRALAAASPQPARLPPTPRATATAPVTWPGMPPPAARRGNQHPSHPASARYRADTSRARDHRCTPRRRSWQRPN
jgi:hypothetical protein